MAKKNTPENALLEITLKAVDRLGTEKTVSVLENAITIQDSAGSDIVEFILAIVCKEFKVSKDELLFGKSRRKRTPAIACASYLLLKHSNLNQHDLSPVLHKKQGAISKHNTFIENLSDNSPSPYEQEILKKVVFLNEKVKNFKNQKIVKSKK